SFASFERVVLCHALAIAYSQVLNESIFRLTTLIRSNEDEETLLLYEEILKFNAADYFSFPVRIDRHELFSVWQTLAKHYRLKELSCEVTQQLSDIAQLLRAKNDRLLASQEKERERIANLAKDLENKRDKTRAFRLTVLGLVIAASSLPSCTPEQFAKARDSWLVFFKDNTPEKKTGN
ncbi:MAG TPA: hypothetical protein VFV28_02655, partial [Limnobacter sp.]|nr:hypothetical protein [Limnobacter sp.]